MPRALPPPTQDTPAPAPDAPAQSSTPAVDAHAGRGGLYHLIDGQRVLQQRTADDARTEGERDGQ